MARMLIVFNCLAIVASILGYVHFLVQTWKGSRPSSKAEREKQVYIFISISIIAVSLLIFLSFRLKSNIETLEQTGTFAEYAQGVQEVFYSVPYKYPPKLEFINRNPHYVTHGPRVLEQRRDGFKVEINLDSSGFDWKAVGVQGQ